jgi:hypothetical protein
VQFDEKMGVDNRYRSVLDFNPINTIASHMAYWSDEDVNHFVLSQLLSSRSSSKGSFEVSPKKEPA